MFKLSPEEAPLFNPSLTLREAWSNGQIFCQRCPAAHYRHTHPFYWAVS